MTAVSQQWQHHHSFRISRSESFRDGFVDSQLEKMFKRRRQHYTLALPPLSIPSTLPVTSNHSVEHDVEMVQFRRSYDFVSNSYGQWGPKLANFKIAIITASIVCLMIVIFIGVWYFCFRSASSQTLSKYLRFFKRRPWKRLPCLERGRRGDDYTSQANENSQVETKSRKWRLPCLFRKDKKPTLDPNAVTPYPYPKAPSSQSFHLHRSSSGDTMPSSLKDSRETTFQRKALPDFASHSFNSSLKQRPTYAAYVNSPTLTSLVPSHQSPRLRSGESLKRGQSNANDWHTSGLLSPSPCQTSTSLPSKLSCEKDSCEKGNQVSKLEGGSKGRIGIGLGLGFEEEEDSQSSRVTVSPETLQEANFWRRPLQDEDESSKRSEYSKEEDTNLTKSQKKKGKQRQLDNGLDIETFKGEGEGIEVSITTRDYDGEGELARHSKGHTIAPFFSNYLMEGDHEELHSDPITCHPEIERSSTEETKGGMITSLLSIFGQLQRQLSSGPSRTTSRTSKHSRSSNQESSKKDTVEQPISIESEQHHAPIEISASPDSVHAPKAIFTATEIFPRRQRTQGQTIDFHRPIRPKDAIFSQNLCSSPEETTSKNAAKLDRQTSLKCNVHIPSQSVDSNESAGQWSDGPFCLPQKLFQDEIRTPRPQSPSSTQDHDQMILTPRQPLYQEGEKIDVQYSSEQGSSRWEYTPETLHHRHSQCKEDVVVLSEEEPGSPKNLNSSQDNNSTPSKYSAESSRSEGSLSSSLRRSPHPLSLSLSPQDHRSGSESSCPLGIITTIDQRMSKQSTTSTDSSAWDTRYTLSDFPPCPPLPPGDWFPSTKVESHRKHLSISSSSSSSSGCYSQTQSTEPLSLRRKSEDSSTNSRRSSQTSRSSYLSPTAVLLPLYEEDHPYEEYQASASR